MMKEDDKATCALVVVVILCLAGIVILTTSCKPKTVPVVPVVPNECQEVMPPPLPPAKPKAIGMREDDGSVIDVMVVYTKSARQASGSSASIETQIQNAISNTNSAYASSGAVQRIHLVKTGEVAYIETGSASTDLQNLALNKVLEVPGWREQYAADCVSMICENIGGVCGTGYLLTSMNSNFAQYACNVVARGCLSNFSLAHELGHNMGLSHDHANASFAFSIDSYGWRTADGLDRCIMSYAPGTRRNRFSNPSLPYNGKQFGQLDYSNGARVLNMTAKLVANFRLSKTTEPTPIPTVTPTPTPELSPSPTPVPPSDITWVSSPGTLARGQTFLMSWNIPAAGKVMPYLFKGISGTGGKWGLTPTTVANDGQETVTVPATIPFGVDYYLVVKLDVDGRKFPSPAFEIRK